MIVRRAMCEKASQPWIIWEGVTKLIHSLRTQINQQTPVVGLSSASNRLDQFGLLSPAKANTDEDRHNAQRSRFHTLVQFFWNSLHVASITWLVLRSFVIALMHASSIPARQDGLLRTNSPHKVRISAVAPASPPNPQHTIKGDGEKRPVVTMRIWTCLKTLTCVEQRMPWLTGFFSLLQWLSLYGPGQLCTTDSVLDR